jgi:hypothetical protein
MADDSPNSGDRVAQNRRALIPHGAVVDALHSQTAAIVSVSAGRTFRTNIPSNPDEIELRNSFGTVTMSQPLCSAWNMFNTSRGTGPQQLRVGTGRRDLFARPHMRDGIGTSIGQRVTLR